MQWSELRGIQTGPRQCLSYEVGERVTSRTERSLRVVGWAGVERGHGDWSWGEKEATGGCDVSMQNPGIRWKQLWAHILL
jgi:hypothetical protein